MHRMCACMPIIVLPLLRGAVFINNCISVSSRGGSWAALGLDSTVSINNCISGSSTAGSCRPGGAPLPVHDLHHVYHSPIRVTIIMSITTTFTSALLSLTSPVLHYHYHCHVGTNTTTTTTIATSTTTITTITIAAITAIVVTASLYHYSITISSSGSGNVFS